MRKCTKCGNEIVERTEKTPEGISYAYFHCNKCNEEIVDLKQLHEVAEKYREIKQYKAKVSKWGLSLGIRIPKELAKNYNLSIDEQVTLIPEKEGIKIIPA